MAIRYRVVTSNVPEGAHWKSVEVSRHSSLAQAKAAAMRLRRAGKPSEVQGRFFPSEPWRFWLKPSDYKGFSVPKRKRAFGGAKWEHEEWSRSHLPEVKKYLRASKNAAKQNACSLSLDFLVKAAAHNGQYQSDRRYAGRGSRSKYGGGAHRVITRTADLVIACFKRKRK